MLVTIYTSFSQVFFSYWETSAASVTHIPASVTGMFVSHGCVLSQHLAIDFHCSMASISGFSQCFQRNMLMLLSVEINCTLQVQYIRFRWLMDILGLFVFDKPGRSSTSGNCSETDNSFTGCKCYVFIMIYRKLVCMGFCTTCACVCVCVCSYVYFI